MRYSFFTNSKRAWAKMYEVISSAENSIFFEMYIFEDNAIGFDFVTLLANKAMSGVKVKILLDAFGSLSLPKEKLDTLRQSGV